jgi:hypothetical protein
MTPSAQTAGGRRVRRWTRELIIEKILEWEARYGEPPCSADWNPSLARWRAQEWRAERYRDGLWPSTNAAKRPFGGSFDAAIRAAGLEPRRPGPKRAAGEAAPTVETRPDRTCGGDEVAVALDRARRAETRTAALERELLVAKPRAEGAEALERLEAVIADADARIRASDDQAEAAVRDAAEARRALAAAARRARELSALVGDGQRRLTAEEMSALRNGGGASGPAVLAAALRRLAKARAAGDRGGLRSALGEIASAAVRWHDRL